MQPLTMDDLLPLQEFVARRRELFAAQCRYIDRYRRIRVGPGVALSFENRQTLWFRAQEVLRVARLSDPGRVQAMLDVYNRLLPGPNQLHAALVLDISDGPQFLDKLCPWQAIQDEDIRFQIGAVAASCQLVTCRPEDRCIGAAHWLRFTLDLHTRSVLGDFRQSAHVEIQVDDLTYTSASFSEDVRQSLLDDLQLSDRRKHAA